MSATGTSGFSHTWASSRSAWALSACSDLADSTHGTVTAPAGTGTVSGSAVDSSAGACSMITCAFVPLTPNEETPARRGRSCAAGHSWASVSSSTAPADQSTLPDGRSTCSVGGSTPWRIAMTILMTPATPAAAWVWPTFDLMEPSHSGRPSAGRSWPYVVSSAWASIGSPRVVPVPCASTASTSAGVRPASARAARMTRCCEGPFGAVRPLDAPSWLTAEPRSTASTW